MNPREGRQSKWNWRKVKSKERQERALGKPAVLNFSWQQCHSWPSFAQDCAHRLILFRVPWDSALCLSLLQPESGAVLAPGSQEPLGSQVCPIPRYCFGIAEGIGRADHEVFHVWGQIRAVGESPKGINPSWELSVHVNRVSHAFSLPGSQVDCTDCTFFTPNAFRSMEFEMLLNRNWRQLCYSVFSLLFQLIIF